MVAFVRTFIPERYLHPVGIFCLVAGVAGFIFGLLTEQKKSPLVGSSRNESTELTAWDTPAYYTEMLEKEKSKKPRAPGEPDR